MKKDKLTGRYDNPTKVGFIGWIEPKSKEWIEFVGLDGKVTRFDERDPKTGAVAE